MSKLIYVVQGSTGEYSDRTDWLVCAFEDKEQATTYEQDLTDLSNKYYKGLESASFPYYASREDLTEDLKEVYTKLLFFDPKFQMDYTGTSYWVKEIELR